MATSKKATKKVAKKKTSKKATKKVKKALATATTCDAKLILSEVYKTKFSIFDSLGAEEKLKQIDLVTYIESMSQDMEKDLTDVNLFELFPSANNTLTLEKKEINKILLGFKREDLGLAEKIVYELTEKNIEAIKKGFAKRKVNQVENYENDINYNKDDIKSYYGNITNKIKAIRVLQTKIDDINNGKNPEIIDQIQNLFKDGLITEFISMDGDRICLASPDIITTYKNEKAGIDLRMNFGQLKYSINLRNGDFKCSEFKNNTDVSGHVHPHINSSGGWCLGNMHEVMQDAIRHLNIYDMINTGHLILNNYNHESPYASFEEFCKKSKQVQPDGKYVGQAEEEKREKERLERDEKRKIEREAMKAKGVIACQNCDFEFVTKNDDGEMLEDTSCPECGDDN